MAAIKTPSQQHRNRLKGKSLLVGMKAHYYHSNRPLSETYEAKPSVPTTMPLKPPGPWGSSKPKQENGYPLDSHQYHDFLE
jgi:hypothetical protein